MIPCRPRGGCWSASNGWSNERLRKERGGQRWRSLHLLYAVEQHIDGILGPEDIPYLSIDAIRVPARAVVAVAAVVGRGIPDQQRCARHDRACDGAL